MARPRTRRLTGLRAAAVAALGASLFYYLVAAMPLPFMPAVWSTPPTAATDRLHLRHRIADGLVLSGRLRGLPLKDVVALLGAPSDSGYFRDWSLAYDLGRERGFISIDDEWLVVRTNRDGLVTTAAIVRD